MARRHRQQADPQGGRGVNVQHGNGAQHQRRGEAAMALVAAGVPQDQAWQYVNSHGLDTPEAARQWASTWGQIDWSQGAQEPTTGNAPPADSTAPPGPSDETLARRQSVYDAVMGFFQNLGLPGQEMSDYLRKPENVDLEDWQLIDGVRQQSWYIEKFDGLNELRREQAQEGWDEAKWMTQRAAYMEALKFMPEGFYDSPADFSNFMRNRVSPLEVERRALFARQQLEEADPEMRKALRDFYGISDGALTAYLLDPTRAQTVIDREMRAASYQRYVLESGRTLTQAEAERISSLTGAVGDALTAEGQTIIRNQIDTAVRLDTQDSFLSAIDGDNSYSFVDSVEAALGDTQKRLKSEQRAKREQARFGGSSGLGRGSLAKKRGD